jgi:hypothetical protein
MMHRFKFYLLFLLVLASCATTNRVDREYFTAIELVNMHVLYAREENHINVLVEGLDLKDVDVSIDNGNIHGRDGKYVVVPEEKGTAVLAIRYKGNLIKSITYQVKLGLKLACYLVTDSNLYYMKNRQDFTKSELLNSDRMVVGTPNSDFDPGFEIKQFTLSIKENDSIVDIVSNGNQFTEEQKRYIQQAKDGTKATIGDVKLLGSDGSRCTLGGFRIVIKDDN